MLILILSIIIGLSVIITVVLAYGSHRWQAATREMHARLAAARHPLKSKIYHAAELRDLPAPVQRYFRTVLQDGQPLVQAVSIEHVGTFNMGESIEKWKPFTSCQRVITQRPGFDWEARIAMLPGLSARVHDAYIAGQGILHASLLGLVPLVDQRSTPDLARGELMRFLAEAAWYPTALLPSQGVCWEGVDDLSAKATLRDDDITVTLLFRFTADGLIESVRAAARGRIIAGSTILTPWEGRWSNYELRDNMQIPLQGEVAWLLPGGPKPYWRGRITRINYEFSR
jgi:hypothetical protein